MDGEVISPALAVLLEIMTSTSVEEVRCVEAAKAIVEYEAPPSVYEMASKYLLWVAQDDKQDTRLRLEALTIMRKIEARRIVPGTTQGQEAEVATALSAKIAAARERVALRAKGEAPPLRLVAAGEQLEGNGVAARLHRARRAQGVS